MAGEGTRHYVHATAVVIGEAGVLIRGPSGSGKSSLALRLIADAGRWGRFARLVGDDRVGLRKAGDLIVAEPHPLIAGLIERRTRPIADVPYEHQCVLRLVVDLLSPPLPRVPEGPRPTIRLLDHSDLPVMHLEARCSDIGCLAVLEEMRRS